MVVNNLMQFSLLQCNAVKVQQDIKTLAYTEV